MAELRERFWELDLDELTRAEWEALCDGCGKCCLHKLEDEDTGEIAETNVACKLLDTGTAQCRDYRHRKAFVPDCLRLTPKLVKQVPWLPDSCAYVRRARGQDLPRWHHLLTGSRDAMIEAGACVAGRCVSETVAGPLEHHVVDWEEERA
ncbi:YcgN family cysteine cluster protein [Aurantiacibacter poecillastricola]|uniref:YcgN family cysteine cluster protein n=1 Tax=Aurantiacibacter poecillastricola TaxID=3064385 RepID=UPI00273E2E71|nr:YcgN family cysteine cluster protein [Aurantiacibacter sp. 219JJ12-13]MDP5263193.1 YcgN family cysteine cluster protein [Aurantiacibacter sp. 219JJ12-13]